MSCFPLARPPLAAPSPCISSHTPQPPSPMCWLRLLAHTAPAVAGGAGCCRRHRWVPPESCVLSVCLSMPHISSHLQRHPACSAARLHYSSATALNSTALNSMPPDALQTSFDCIKPLFAPLTMRAPDCHPACGTRPSLPHSDASPIPLPPAGLAPALPTHLVWPWPCALCSLLEPPASVFVSLLSASPTQCLSTCKPDSDRPCVVGWRQSPLRGSSPPPRERKQARPPRRSW